MTCIQQSSTRPLRSEGKSPAHANCIYVFILKAGTIFQLNMSAPGCVSVLIILTVKTSRFNSISSSLFSYPSSLLPPKHRDHRPVLQTPLYHRAFPTHRYVQVGTTPGVIIHFLISTVTDKSQYSLHPLSHLRLPLSPNNHHVHRCLSKLSGMSMGA
jgi:hypothetical protein